MLSPTVRRFVAGALVVVLGLVLLSALLPYASGLLGAPMLYVIWEPVQRRLVRRIPAPLAASLIILLSLLLIVLPGSWLVTMLVSQAQGAAQSLVESPLLARLQQLTIGPVALGPALASMGEDIITWLGTNALSLIGTATRAILNLVFMFFGLYYLLIHPGRAWGAVEPYIPFSRERSAALRDRFTAVTYSTVIGTGMIAVVQGMLLGIGFWATGIPNAVFWGAVTAVLSILPLVGSGMVWLPASIGLFLNDMPGRGLALALWGALVIGNVDNILRPVIYNRYAKIHPMITLVGAIVGVQQMGFVGLILGPLAISYFFELIRMFGEEYQWTAPESTSEVGPESPAHPISRAGGTGAVA